MRGAPQVDVGADGRLSAETLRTGEAHPLIHLDAAINLGLVTRAYAKDSNYCPYKFCFWAAMNKKKKCGERGEGREQAPRSKAAYYCMHPACMRAYHPTCYSVMHRLVETCRQFDFG